MSGQNTTNKDGIDLISYANTIFHSIDANLWLIFVVAVALIWLSAFFQRRRAYIMRGVITYLLLILLVTLFSREGTHHRPPELLPLWSWLEVFRSRNSELLCQIILNVLLFLPLGSLLYCCTAIQAGHHPLMSIWLIGLGISTCIEISQLLFQLGLFEFDDIIHNSLGCLIGGAAIGTIRQKGQFPH